MTPHVDDVRVKKSVFMTTEGNGISQLSLETLIFFFQKFPADPKIYWSQEIQHEANSSFNVALLVMQLVSLILLLPMALVLVSFYRIVSKQRRRANTQFHSAVVNSSLSQDESFGNQNTRLTNATYENSDIGDNV